MAASVSTSPSTPGTMPPGAGGIDPTQALYDPDAMTFIASGDVPLKVSTAPVYYAEGHQPGSGLPVSEGGTPNTTRTSNSTGDWS